jgi:hypothetical protein
VNIPEATLASALDVMNDAALSPKERLQKLVDIQAAALQDMVAEQTSAWNTLQEQWRQQSQALPEIGGQRLTESLAQIKKGLDSAGANPAFYDALTVTGAGNHPEVIRVLHALTKPFVEKSPVSGSPPKGSLSAAERLYPSMAKE